MGAPALRLTGFAEHENRSAGSTLWWFTERVAAGAGLTVLAPALAGVMLTVRMLSRRSPLIAHQRMGKHGRPFWMLKIRTMWDRHEPARGPSWIEYLADTDVPAFKTGQDPRVTSRFAAFCRKYSIDELPQLFHVLTGEMRLAGPRPMTRAELDCYYADAQHEVLSVSPGLTGLWQVSGRNRRTYAQRRRLDLFFVRKACAGLYWKIMLQTPARVLSGRDAW
jgi:lipopolysaccharide/colanic/teichoic acid biosynthesis glycosyltransferase